MSCSSLLPNTMRTCLSNALCDELFLFFLWSTLWWNFRRMQPRVWWGLGISAAPLCCRTYERDFWIFLCTELPISYKPATIKLGNVFLCIAFNSLYGYWRFTSWTIYMNFEARQFCSSSTFSQRWLTVEWTCISIFHLQWFQKGKIKIEKKNDMLILV